MVDKKLEELYEKNSDIQKNDIKNLMNWVQLQPHLPNIAETEMMLFLHACLNSMELTKTVIDNYYTFRTHCPEFFSHREDIFEDNILDIVLFYFLPKTSDGTSTLFFKILDSNVSKFHFERVLKLMSMVYDLYLKQEGPTTGHKILVDFSDVVFGHLTRINPLCCKKYAWYLQEALPIRKSGMYIVNIYPFVDKLLNMLKPFIKKEEFEMINLYSSADGLEKIFPRKTLPKCFGGDGPTVEEMQEFMKKELNSNKHYFNMEEKTRRINEKLRPEKTRNPGDLFGIEGSFKKLDID